VVNKKNGASDDYERRSGVADCARVNRESDSGAGLRAAGMPTGSDSHSSPSMSAGPIAVCARW
jgi:hypothetical protein